VLLYLVCFGCPSVLVFFSLRWKLTSPSMYDVVCGSFPSGLLAVEVISLPTIVALFDVSFVLSRSLG